MEDIYVNVDYDKSVHSRPSTNQTGPRSSERRFHGAVVLCLGLLSVFLLAGLIGLSVHYYNSVHAAAAELANIKTNMTELLQDSKNKVLFLTEERDQLNVSLIKTSAELQSLSRQSIESWSFYFLSSESGSWSRGREDCRNRGADLVVIDSDEEQKFLCGFSNVDTWIGLSDADEEGTWKWIDGTAVTSTYWKENQPDNGGRDARIEEDCAHIIDTKWNDLPCETFLRWICEKKA